MKPMIEAIIISKAANPLLSTVINSPGYMRGRTPYSPIIASPKKVEKIIKWEYTVNDNYN